MKKLAGNKNFRVILIGRFVSMVGDQMSLVALPWLILSLTGDPVYVGITLGLMGIPRAILILFSGGMVDRYNPLSVLKYSRLLSFALLVVLSAAIPTGSLSIAIIYVFALLLGALGAVAMPAGMSLLPSVLKREELGAGNGLTMSVTQIAALVGPIAAGAILGWYGLHMEQGSSAVAAARDLTGFSVVFMLDALTFLVSYLMLLRVKLATVVTAPAINALKMLVSGFNYIKANPTLSSLLLYISAISLLVLGPTQVGVPLLVQENFAGNSVIFGSLKTAHGAGALAGSILAAVLARHIFAYLGTLVLSADIIIGVLFIFFANTTNVLVVHISIFIVGVLGGVVQVGVFSWVQGNARGEYMGRVMSYLMFASLGLVPVSAFLSGYVIEWFSAKLLFEGIGCGMATIALSVLALSARVRNLRYKTAG